MGNMTKIRQGFYVISLLTAAVLFAFGCGGGGSSTDFDDWTGPTVPIRISGYANTNGTVTVDASGNLVCKDASDSTLGEGSDGDGIDSINDSANIECVFSIESGSTTDLGYTPIVSDSGSCGSLNNCIICDITAQNDTCGIDCSGTLPSNDTIASDSITLIFEAIADFTSDMPAPDGVIRFDGLLTDWSSIDPQSDKQSYDLTGCDGSSGVMTILDNDPNSDNAASASAWNDTFDISLVGNGICNDVTASLKKTYSFAGAENGATWDGVDITGGSILVTSQICDTPNCSALPLHFSKSFGTAATERAQFNNIDATNDGGVVIASTASNDAHVMKLSSEGSVEWEKSYDSGSIDEAHSIKQVSDGGYIVAGLTQSGGAGEEVLVFKLSSGGINRMGKTLRRSRS